jgi:SAM-dependent methyltransferase
VSAKPRGLEPHYAEQFCDASIVEAYTARPPYPDALDPLLIEVVGGVGARVLDLGCGTAELVRRLAPTFQSVTAIDHSERMIARARALPGGVAPNIRWLVGRVEDVALDGTFTAALAAQSFHWFDWPVLVRRLMDCVPSRRLVLVERREAPAPWSEPLQALYRRFSTNQDFEPYDLVDELKARRYLTVHGTMTHSAQPFRQTIDDYVTSLHSQNGFSRDRMSLADAAAFGEAVRAAVAPHAPDGIVRLPVITRVVWGSVSLPD